MLKEPEWTTTLEQKEQQTTKLTDKKQQVLTNEARQQRSKETSEIQSEMQEAISAAQSVIRSENIKQIQEYTQEWKQRTGYNINNDNLLFAIRFIRHDIKKIHPDMKKQLDNEEIDTEINKILSSEPLSQTGIQKELKHEDTTLTDEEKAYENLLQQTNQYNLKFQIEEQKRFTQEVKTFVKTFQYLHQDNSAYKKLSLEKKSNPNDKNHARNISSSNRISSTISRRNKKRNKISPTTRQYIR